MKIFNSPIISKKYKGSAIAIGNFDGVHKGHQKVFAEQAKKFAKKNKIRFGILTFTPLPVMFFNKKVSNYRLTSEDQKFKTLKKYGIDFLVNIKFNKTFSKISAIKFIKNIVYKKINPKLIFVSNNFKFGNKRKGNVNLLKKFSKKYDYKLLKINPFRDQGKIISSTKIRKYLQTGNLDLANKLLSRTWFIDGRVKSGKKLGRKLGYRTCNIHIKDYILPKSGTYAVKVMIDNKKKIYNGVAYLGSVLHLGVKKFFLKQIYLILKKICIKKS